MFKIIRIIRIIILITSINKKESVSNVISRRIFFANIVLYSAEVPPFGAFLLCYVNIPSRGEFNERLPLEGRLPSETGGEV